MSCLPRFPAAVTGACWLLSLAVLGLGLAAPALAAPVPLSLARAQDLALANHPSLRVAAEQLRQAEIALWEAYFGLASLTGDLNGLQKVERTGMGSPDEGSDREQSYLLDLHLSVPIYNGGLTAGQIGRAAALRDQSRLDLAIARLDVLQGVTTAYWEAKRQEILYGVVQETLRQAQDTYNFSRVRLQAGAAAPIDFNRAQVNLINTQDSLTQERGQLATAKVGLLAQAYARLPDFTLSDEPARTPPPAPLDQALALAQRRRPEIRRALLDVRVREEELRIAAAGFWPTLGLDAHYLYGNDTFTIQGGTPVLPLATTITGNPSSSINLSLTLQYRFWDNGSTMRKVSTAEAALAIARQQLAVARRGAETDVRQAYIALQNAADRLQNLERAVAIARDNLRIINLRYKLGVALVIELSDVQASLAQTLTNRANALIDYRVAQTNLARAVGAEEWLRAAR